MKDQSTILIVDDQETNRQILEDHVRLMGHKSMLAENGLSALAKIGRDSPDLVLLDIMMPVMDGHEVLEKMGANSSTRDIPVIVISALDDIESVVRAISNGAEDYLLKPFNAEILRARVGNSLEKKRLREEAQSLRRKLEDYNLQLEDRVQEQVRQISQAHLSSIFAMCKLAESRDRETGEHLERMQKYCKILVQQLETLPKFAAVIDRGYVENIYWASPLHDIGKVGVPDHVLQKPGKLTPEEFAVMQKHPILGAETLRAVSKQYPENDFLRIGIEITESHHEKWDGSGYPHGLAGEDIPLSGRIVALGDVYDALTSKRCYKEAFTHERSREMILKDRGTHFDPDLVDAFLEVEQKFGEIRGARPG